MKVYFSRDPRDTAQADEDRFSQTLREAGLEPVDGAADLAAGNDWQQTIGEKLNTSDALVFVIGPESEKSPWLQRQWSASVEESWTNPDKPMIPILIGNAEPPPFLRDRNAIHVASENDLDAAARSVIAALEGGAKGNVVTSPDAERELATQWQQRLSEIAQEAAKLEPSPGDKRFRAGNQPLGAVLTEISGARGPQRGSARPTARQTPGSAAEKIGTLLLAGAIVSMRSAAVEENATPLVIIEDPEAHLHPMTLASVWNLIERIAAQKIICTHSGSLLAAAPLASLRRLTRQAGDVREWRVPPGTLSHDELRRYTYHVRSRRDVAHFARCWLLVEGETEYWLLGELARLCGYSFAAEGIVCVEFAQCGVAPISSSAGARRRGRNGSARRPALIVAFGC